MFCMRIANKVQAGARAHETWPRSPWLTPPLPSGDSIPSSLLGRSVLSSCAPPDRKPQKIMNFLLADARS
jgi:hypothetical protein